MHKAVRDNYRPVSLLSCVSKLFERAVFKYVFNFLRDNNVISLKQSGFMPGDSTVYQLTYLYHIFQEALDCQKDIRVVFCDISKAFDRVWHAGLIAKLSRIGISGSLLNWFQSYLELRYQRTVINGQCSSWGIIKAGVPQGSVLGPLLFLIYINDITNVTENSDVRLFADDTILYLLVDNPVANAQALNTDLKNVSKWASEWLINFSPHKTKTMVVSRKRKAVHYPPLNMNGTMLQEVQSHKHLGVTLSKDLSWDQHIEDVATKANQCLDILNALKFKLDRVTLEKLYFAFVRSKLEYASILWDCCSKQLSDLIESVHYRAAKIISGAIHRTSHALIYNELGWDNLENRRKKQRLRVFFKASHGNAPIYLQNIIPTRDMCNNYNLRNNDTYPILKCRTSNFQKSFLPRTVSDWNNLDNDIRLCDSVGSFTRMLNTDISKPPIWYNAGERRLNILHARLRMLCSPLNDHLYSAIHVVDNPNCPCGFTHENNRHYLLDCQLYVNEREDLLRELNQLGFDPLLSNLLYGDSSLSSEKNVKAFISIQKFIKSTKRFE